MLAESRYHRHYEGGAPIGVETVSNFRGRIRLGANITQIVIKLFCLPTGNHWCYFFKIQRCRSAKSYHLPDADAELEAVDGARAVGVQHLLRWDVRSNAQFQVKLASLRSICCRDILLPDPFYI